MDMVGGSSDEVVLRQRLAKAESEAIKATNERLAAEKRAAAIKVELEGKVADLQEELTLRDGHVKALEQEGVDFRAALAPLGISAHAPQDQVVGRVRELTKERAEASEAHSLLEELTATSAPSTSRLTLREIVQTTRQRVQELDCLALERQKIIELTQKQRDSLQEDVTKASHLESNLRRRERELAASRKRLRKLATTLKKVVPSWTAGNITVAGQTSGDATFSSLTIADETVGGESLVAGRDFETDMLDEMEQLMTFVDDLDQRLEFQKVEDEAQRQESNKRLAAIHSENDALKSRLAEVIAEASAHQGTIIVLHEQLSAQQQRLDTETDGFRQKLLTAEQQVSDCLATIAALEQRLNDEEDSIRTRQNELHAKDAEHDAANQKVRAEAQTQLETAERLARAAQEDLESRLYRQMELTDLEVKAKAELFTTLEDERQERESEIAALHDKLVLTESSKTALENELRDRIAASCSSQEKLAEAQYQLAALSEIAQKMERDVEKQFAEKQIARDEELLEKLSLAHKKIKAYDILAEQLRNEYMRENEAHREALVAAASQSQQLSAFGVRMNELNDKIKARTNEATSLHIELDQERTNRKLAEDALDQFVSSRESDATVCLDTRASELDSSVCDPIARDVSVGTSASLDKLDKLQKDLSDLKLCNEGLEAEIKLFALERETSQQKSKDLLQQLQQSRAELSDKNQHHNAIQEQLTNQVKALTQQMSQLSNGDAETDPANASVPRSPKLIELEEQLQQAEGRLLAVENELCSSEQALQVSNTQLKRSHDERSELQQDLKSVSYALSKAQRDVKKANEESLSIQQRVLTLEAGMGEALAHRESEAKSAEDEIISLRDRLDKSEEMRTTLEQRLTQWQQRSSDASSGSARSVSTEEIDTLRSDLAQALQTIERLERELAMKAQECEDADDKELALRKDNKRLLSKMSALQSRLNKMQLQAPRADLPSNKDGTKTTDAAHSDAIAISSLSSPAAINGTTRKRSLPDDEEKSRHDRHQNHGELSGGSRAIVYAPASSDISLGQSQMADKVSDGVSGTTAKQGSVSFSFVSPATRPRMQAEQSRTPTSQRKRRPRTSTGSRVQDSAKNRLASLSASVTDHTPSKRAALQTQENVAELDAKSGAHSSPSSRFRDRTNQPRSIVTAGETDHAVLVKPAKAFGASLLGAAGTDTKSSDVLRQNTPFMAKLNRFKPQQA